MTFDEVQMSCSRLYSVCNVVVACKYITFHYIKLIVIYRVFVTFPG